MKKESTIVTPLMPKATAVWLIKHTTLTFEQIGEFCGFHMLEVNGIADGDVARGITEINPIQMGQLSKEEIKRCEADSTQRLHIAEGMSQMILTERVKKKKVGKYTPIARRQDKPSGIAWLLKHCPELSENAIAKLLGATKDTIRAIKNKTHWNHANIKAKDPVMLGLCSQTELNRVYESAKNTTKKEVGKEG
ncbi:conserved hypothetical protein [Alphaproteobacteria bacterium]